MNKLALPVHDSYEAIVDAYCDARADLIAIPARFTSTTVRDWAELSRLRSVDIRQR